MNIEIGEENAEFVAARIEEGLYHSATEVVTAGLRLLQDEETKKEALRSALVSGEQSGNATSFDIEKFISSRQTISHG
jgi:antitoxin ParD1/3/4